MHVAGADYLFDFYRQVVRVDQSGQTVAGDKVAVVAKMLSPGRELQEDDERLEEPALRKTDWSRAVVDEQYWTMGVQGSSGKRKKFT